MDSIEELVIERRLTHYAERTYAAESRAEAAEAELAAVPVAEIRRIIEMHDAHQWSSVESPPLYAAVRAWLEVQP